MSLPRLRTKTHPAPSWLVPFISPGLATFWLLCHPADIFFAEAVVQVFLALNFLQLIYVLHCLSDVNTFQKTELGPGRRIWLAISVHPFRRTELLPIFFGPFATSGSKPCGKFELLHELAHFRYAHALGYSIDLTILICLFFEVHHIATFPIYCGLGYLFLAEVSRQQELQADAYAAGACEEEIASGLHDTPLQAQVPIMPTKLASFMWKRTLPNLGWRRVVYFGIWYSLVLYGNIVPFLYMGVMAVAIARDSQSDQDAWLFACGTIIGLAWLGGQLTERLLRGLGIKTFYMRVTRMPTFLLTGIRFRPQKYVREEERQLRVQSYREHRVHALGPRLLASWRLFALATMLFLVAAYPEALLGDPVSASLISSGDRETLKLVNDVDTMFWVEDSDQRATVLRTLWEIRGGFKKSGAGDEHAWPTNLSVERQRSNTSVRYSLLPGGTNVLVLPKECATILEVALRPEQGIARKQICFGTLQRNWRPLFQGPSFLFFAIPILSVALLMQPWRHASNLLPVHLGKRARWAIWLVNILIPLAITACDFSEASTSYYSPPEEDWRLHLDLAIAQLKRGAYEETIVSCERALRINPTSGIAMAVLAESYYHGDDAADRRKAFMRRAIEFDPKFPLPYSRLAHFLRVDLDLVTAGEVLEEGLFRNPRDVELRKQLAEIRKLPNTRLSLEKEAREAIETAMFLKDYPARKRKWLRAVHTFPDDFLQRLPTAIRAENAAFLRGERDIITLLDKITVD